MTLVLPSPALPDPASVPALRWGVVGTGSIAGMFTRAVLAHTGQHIAAVTARDETRLRAFADEHGIARTHASVGELVADPDIDVVYVATPHVSHAAVALQAIAAGKHVLVEKPFALSAAEAEQVTSAARSAGVLAMEAMWTRYLPQSDIVRQLLESGVIGAVHTVFADFGFAAPFDPTNRMWDQALGGGALLDAGIYPISFASSVIGAPTSISASGQLTSTGVDARASLLLTAATGQTALLSTSMVSSHPTRATIIGAAGRIELGSPFFGPTSVTVETGSFGSGETATWSDDRFEILHDGLSYQATALASYVAAGLLESPIHPHEEIVSVLATIDEARRQIAAAAAAEGKVL